MPDLNDLERDLGNMESAMNNLGSRFPAIIGNESVRILRENFMLQGYDSGKGFRKWKKRSKATNTFYDYNRTSSYRTPKLGKKSIFKNPLKGSVVSSKSLILLQTGNLRDSISYRTSGQIVEIGVFPRSIVINGKTHNAVVYAKIHNEGGTGKWGSHSTKMPRRQFMPRPSDNPNEKIIVKAKEKWVFEEQKIMSKFEKT
jgi:phage gpG-like protein